MPSLRLPRLIRRNPDRPTLKERAAALRATAAKVMRRKPAAGLATDSHALTGGMVHHDGTVTYCDAGGRVYRGPVADWINFTAQRLYTVARTEMARQANDPALSQDEWEAVRDNARRGLRFDALRILVCKAREAYEAGRAAPNLLPDPPPVELPGAGAVSPDLIRAVEAHREAVQLAAHDPVDDDARADAIEARVRALADAIRAFEARSLADLRHKVLYLWPGDLDDEVLDRELGDTFRSFHDDVLRLAWRPADAAGASSSEADPPRRDVVLSVGAALTGAIVGVPVYRTGIDLSAVADGWIRDARELGMLVMKGPDGNLWRVLPLNDGEDRQAARERHWVKLNDRPQLLRAVYDTIEGGFELEDGTCEGAPARG